jgi:hypothetical protein
MKYKCWIDGKKETTVQEIEAETAFLARQRIATQYGVKTFQCIAVRLSQGA